MGPGDLMPVAQAPLQRVAAQLAHVRAVVPDGAGDLQLTSDPHLLRLLPQVRPPLI